MKNRRSRNAERSEFQVDNVSILKYFRKDVWMGVRGTYPELSDEQLADKIISEYLPKYSKFVYTVDLTEEFKHENPMSLKFMFEFLTTPCQNCSGNQCLNAHDPGHLRRPPQRLFTGLWNYNPSLCLLKKCDENCEFSHNQEEVNYHPMKYKTQPCEHNLVNGQCEVRGIYCYKSHGAIRRPSLQCYVTGSTKKEEEKVYEDIPFAIATFKTLPCRLTTTHDKDSCNFYHKDMSDRRRDPSKFKYSSTECPKSFNKEFLCKFKDSCKYSHNEYEKLYHKDIYSTIPCPSPSCKLKEKCPYTHKEETEDKELIYSSLENFRKKSEELEKELKKLEPDSGKLLKFQCSQCENKPSEVILRCGHLSCKECVESENCEICFTNNRPTIEIKFA